MGQGVDEARKQRELSKATLAADLDRLEARVRAELDWRARLRRDGAKFAALGVAAIVLLGGVIVLRGRLRKDRPDAMDEPASLEDVAAELRDIRRTLEKHNGSGGSVAQKALLRALSAAGTAGGTYLARRMVAQRRDSAEEGAEAARAG